MNIRLCITPSLGLFFCYLNNRCACLDKMIIALIYWSLCISIGTIVQVSSVALRPPDWCLGWVVNNSELTSPYNDDGQEIKEGEIEDLVRSGGSNV